MRKVLIITYYWPPAGGPGVQRWLHFVKYLRDFEIDPVVYIPENPSYPLVDFTFNNTVPEGITIYKQPITEPYRIASLLSKKKTTRISSGIIKDVNQSLAEHLLLWIRGNFFIPDARKYWVKPSVQFLRTILKNEGIDTIITTGPPHSVHLIGYALKRLEAVRWIADFRDPWTTIGYHKKLKLTRMAASRHKELENTVLTSADKIVVTSKSTAQEFRSKTNVPIKVITNGFEKAIEQKVTLDKKFTIAHIGSMLSGRNPENLWRVLSEIVVENNAFAADLMISFIGVVSDSTIASIKKYGLEKQLHLVGYVAHKTAINYQQKSQVLLLSEINSEDTKGIIPGKLFEYMASKRPILAIGPDGWDVAEIMTKTKTGAIFNYEAHTELKNVLLHWWHLYKENALAVNSIGLEKYSRKSLTGELANFI